MPYIKPGDRDDLLVPQTAGELNWKLTNECLKFLDGTAQKYDDYNTIIGVLECAKLEFYRRAVASYEDRKIKENGDVY
jgi:hypothetical protein